MDTEVALVLVQDKVLLCPAATTPGEKLMVMVGVDPAAATVTVTEDVADRPFESVAVAVYVVVWDGVTVADPDMGRVPEATAGEMEKDAAFVTCQVSVADWP